ncbi:putative bifunctional diguanylate cyclase/phosphodiesterase [Brevibacillus dissolubilis]|uniref:putative bifunctional diguanylate cyclase/phosphodiesterase n=1 Tax=Brevibacillus dissolubilis TaxID=1844116 RepID=UPI001115E033|nr:EAL domain-containing protein [Brevibacillus dissolubilis]
MPLQALRMRFLVFTALFTLGYYGWITYWDVRNEFLQVLGGDLFSIGGALIGTLLVLSSVPRMAGPDRLFWFLVCLGLGSYATAEVIWFYQEIVLRVEVVTPGICDIFYLLQPLLLLLAAITKIHQHKSRFFGVRLLFDVMVTMVVAMTMSWHFLIEPILNQAGVSWSEMLVVIAYPILDLGLIFAAMTLYFAKGVFPNRALFLLFVSTLCFVITDSIYLYQTVNATYRSGSLLDPLWILPLLLSAQASLYESAFATQQDPSMETSNQRPPSPLDLENMKILVPYAVMALLLVVMLSTSYDDILMIGSILTVLLVIARQIITLAENQKLLTKLNTMSIELDDLVKRRTEELSVKNGQLTDALNRMETMAFYDPLSELPNRRLFEKHLSVELMQASRYRKMVAILFLDVDRFKFINDTLGHLLGDSLLKAVAKRLKTHVPAGDLVARQGGDEFTLMLRDIKDRAEIIRIVQQLQKSLSKPFLVDEQELRITCSIGIAIYPDDGLEPETLMKKADIAMYQVKEQGRNGFSFHTPDMNQAIARKMILEKELHKAIERDEFILYYQPQIDIEQDSMIGIEALLRWQHPTLGMIPPGEFISIAEETGLIIPIGEWVLRTSCYQIKAWHENGLPTVRLGVNISPRQFYQGNLTELVRVILEETDLDPQYLNLEITENIAMQNIEQVIETLHQLKKLGISISMDDFGTGYSSLYFLKHFPIDTLKIDQQFIRDVTEDSDHAAIISAIIAMAAKLELNVIAEGVETDSELGFLKGQRCNEVQGFLYSRPVPAEELEQMLRAMPHVP